MLTNVSMIKEENEEKVDLSGIRNDYVDRYDYDLYGQSQMYSIQVQRNNLITI